MDGDLSMGLCNNNNLHQHHAQTLNTHNKCDLSISRARETLNALRIDSTTVRSAGRLLTCAPEALPSEGALELRDEPGSCWLLVADICLRYSLSSKIFLSPPPGRYFTLSREPILLCALMSSFCSSI